MRQRLLFKGLDIMKALFKKVNLFLKNMGSLWMRHWGSVFFIFFTAVFFLGVFEWYSMVYAPRDSIEDVKAKILQSEGESLDTKKFGEILDIVEERKVPSGNAVIKRDLFY